MKSATIVSALLTGATALKVLQFDIHRTKREVSELSKRDGTVDALIDNAQYRYNLNLSIGTPPQPFVLLLDTGSSDLWVNTANSALCAGTPSNCTGGLFDPNASSTYHELPAPGLDISYADQSGATGPYATDVVTIGNITITNHTIGVANVSMNNYHGVIGVSFPNDESICNSYQQNGTAGNPSSCPTYPTIVQAMADQGYINSVAYSLWLDDLDASTGSILFGGIDTSKYTGDLVALDIIPNPGLSTTANPVYTDMNVQWANLTVTGIDNLWQANDTTIAILDSGTSFTYVPSDVWSIVEHAWNVQHIDATGNSYVNCSYRDEDITFNFTFGGSDGPMISVPVKELVWPFDASDNITFGDGSQACQLTMGPATPGQVLIGDTFLRSAYVVYDLSNKQIAIAQTNFDGGEPNIIEIQGSSDIPNVSSLDTYTMVPAAATSNIPNGTPIGPVSPTATGTTVASPSPYTGAGVTLRAGSGHVLMGIFVTVLTAFTIL